MKGLLLKIPRYRSFYQTGNPPLLPINLTLSLTNRCNSKCLTCNIWKSESLAELTLDEYRKIFTSIGSAPVWLTMSGGEPFLRQDLVEIVLMSAQILQPQIINIPTNGILGEKIIASVDNICRSSPKIKLVINVSVDDIEEKNDKIRGVAGAYQKAKNTFTQLKNLKHKNLTVGLHTVVSKHNVDHIEAVIDHLLAWQPDSYVSEVAEKRVELHTLGSDITPSDEEYIKVLKMLPRKLANRKFKGLSRLTQAIRLEYYDLLIKELETQNPVIPCYAAYSSAQINAAGVLWNCCVLALNMGSLREVGYDFKTLWFSPQAEKIRESLKKGNCFCPLANAHYTSMMFDYPTLLRIGRRYLLSYTQL